MRSANSDISACVGVSGFLAGTGTASKLHFLAMCLRKLGAVQLRLRAPDDRDHIANKQVQCGGSLLATLFRQLWRNFLLELGTVLAKNMEARKKIDASVLLWSRSKFTSRLMHHFYTGQWSLQDPDIKNGWVNLSGCADLHYILLPRVNVFIICSIPAVNTKNIHKCP